MSVETAPRGSGVDDPDYLRCANYVSPPYLLLWAEDGPAIGSYDWYYHPGFGSGAEDGVSPWRDRNGEEIRGVTHWRELPDGPDADH